MSARDEVRSLTAYELFYNYWRVSYFTGGQFDSKVRSMLSLLSQEIVHRNLCELRFHATKSLDYVDEGEGLRVLQKVRDKMEQVVKDGRPMTDTECLFLLSDIRIGIERLSGPRKAGS